MQVLPCSKPRAHLGTSWWYRRRACAIEQLAGYDRLVFPTNSSSSRNDADVNLQLGCRGGVVGEHPVLARPLIPVAQQGIWPYEAPLARR
jgi:hypothetical protein